MPALDLQGKHLDQGHKLAPVLTGCALHDLVHMCGAFILSVARLEIPTFDWNTTH